MVGSHIDRAGVVGADQRRLEIAANLAEVRERVAAACAKAGRDPADVTLVAVTKTRPASDVIHLAQLGVRDVGENRDQEAAPKANEVAAAGVDLTWHFVGQLQRNKCRSVVTYADVVHSVDGVRLAATLAGAAARHRDRPIDVLVQVSLDGDASRGGAVDARAGVTPDPDHDLDRVLDEVARADGVRLRGLMTVAPLEWEPEAAYAAFAGVVDRVRLRYPSATAVSAGMSGDYEQAISYGATHVRVGSALLGNRPPLL